MYKKIIEIFICHTLMCICVYVYMVYICLRLGKYRFMWVCDLYPYKPIHT